MSTHSSSIVDENVVWFKYYLHTLRGNSRGLSIPLFYCTSASILYLHIAYILKHRWFIPLGKLILEDFIAIQNCYSLLWPKIYVLLYNGFQRHWRLFSWANCLRSITKFSETSFTSDTCNFCSPENCILLALRIVFNFGTEKVRKIDAPSFQVLMH